MSVLTPNWPLPPNVKAAISTRQGGGSAAPFASNNLGLHVGDHAPTVQANRALLQSQLQLDHIQWLDQVHSSEVVSADTQGKIYCADASFTTERHLACAVLTADCLPVLFCQQDGQQIAAAHAGWRGLAAGVLLNTLRTFKQPSAVSVYLGPAIGPTAFEVGPEVQAAFPWASDQCFQPGAGDRIFANLYQLASEQLRAAGVTHIFREDFCTYHQDELFYSYRRDGQTGRMVSLIWRN